MARHLIADTTYGAGGDVSANRGEARSENGCGAHSLVRIANVRMNQVRYRSHATYSRQPRQVRKEATVTGSCVCSEVPVPDLFFPQPLFASSRTSDYPLLHSFTTFFR